MTKGNWSGSATLVIFLALTAAGFIAWVVGLALLWLALRAFGLNANYWAMTEALSTAAAAATVVGAGFYRLSRAVRIGQQPPHGSRRPVV